MQEEAPSYISNRLDLMESKELPGLTVTTDGGYL
jgi:hypothetical protein